MVEDLLDLAAGEGSAAALIAAKNAAESAPPFLKLDNPGLPTISVGQSASLGPGMSGAVADSYASKNS